MNRGPTKVPKIESVIRFFVSLDSQNPRGSKI